MVSDRLKKAGTPQRACPYKENLIICLTYLVNVARGSVIDEHALIHALQARWIAGAGLDVVEEERLAAESPLYSLPNVILTPHISGVNVYYDRRLAALFAENLRRYRASEVLRNRYDPERGY